MPHSFTSGPWSFMQSSVAGRYIVSAENTPLDICVLSNRNKSHDEIQENARLIASAPDLLKQRDELLEVVCEFVQTMDLLPDSDETSLCVWAVYDTARELIKAMQRGES